MRVLKHLSRQSAASKLKNAISPEVDVIYVCSFYKTMFSFKEERTMLEKSTGGRNMFSPFCALLQAVGCQSPG